MVAGVVRRRRDRERRGHPEPGRRPRFLPVPGAQRLQRALLPPEHAGRAPVYQIGTDGGLLDAPVRLTSLRLAPAERADLLVDFRRVAPGKTFRISNDAVAPHPSAPVAEADGGSPLPDIMQFRVTGDVGPQAAPPTTLRGGEGQPARLRH